MAVLNLDANGLAGSNGTGKLYIASNYTGLTYNDGDGTNEAAALTALAALTYSDIGYFEKFAISAKNGDERTIMTDYCDIGEISRKKETVFGFKVDVQEILEMANFARIFDATLSTATASHEIIGKKRLMKAETYKCFKFVTCPVGGKSSTFYFVKAVRAGDTSMPFTNLNREDFVGVSLEFEVAEGGNFYIDKMI